MIRNIEMLSEVARGLGDLRKEVVFVGGATVIGLGGVNESFLSRSMACHLATVRLGSELGSFRRTRADGD